MVTNEDFDEFGQLDALESGVASRYQSFKFDDDEEASN